MQGGTTIATLRAPSALDDLRAWWPKDKPIILKLDVTKHGDINATFEHVEGTPEDAAGAMFEVYSLHHRTLVTYPILIITLLNNHIMPCHYYKCNLF